MTGRCASTWRTLGAFRERGDSSRAARFGYVRAISAGVSVMVMMLTAACGLGASADYSQTRSAQQIVSDASKV